MGARRFRRLLLVAWLPLAVTAGGACRGRSLDGDHVRVGNAFLIQSTRKSGPPYRLYTDVTGYVRLVDDNVTRYLLQGTCIFYEARRAGGGVLLVASDDNDRRPYEVVPAKSKEWYLESSGLRRYRQGTDSDGRATIIVETLDARALCARAEAQPGFSESLADARTQAPAVETSTVLVDDVDDRGNTSLHDAATLGTGGLAQALIKAGAAVGARNASGNTPLHVAAIFNQPAVIERLIAAGADVNARNATGFTPLMYASHFHLLQCARLLVRAGANPSLRNDAGQTPVQLAAKANATDIVTFLNGLDRQQSR
jgi:ankyrin repeat protein